MREAARVLGSRSSAIHSSVEERAESVRSWRRANAVSHGSDTTSTTGRSRTWPRARRSRFMLPTAGTCATNRTEQLWSVLIRSGPCRQGQTRVGQGKAGPEKAGISCGQWRTRSRTPGSAVSGRRSASSSVVQPPRSHDGVRERGRSREAGRPADKVYGYPGNPVGRAGRYEP